MNTTHLEAPKRVYGGPMTEREVDLLRDMQAFIDFCIENGLSFRTAVGNIAHDVNGIGAEGDMFEKGLFRPKVQGYRKIRAELVDQMQVMGNDPQVRDEMPIEG